MTSPAGSTNRDLVTARLRLPLIDAAHVEAVLHGPRRAEWAEDYPAEGDVVVAERLWDRGMPAGGDAGYGKRLVVERSTGLVVGGCGFHAPPSGGSVEFGYGIVPSRQGRGYATEAAAELLRWALARRRVREVVAHAEEGNATSIRVLEKLGMRLRSREWPEVEYVATRDQQARA